MVEADRSPRISVVIPVLNEGEGIEAFLGTVQKAVERAPFEIELIVIDGGSNDGTREWLESQAEVKVLESLPGRAIQMNRGADAARAPWLLFLHADTHLDPDHFVKSESLFNELPDKAFAFELRYRNPESAFRRMERGIAWRNRTFGLPYGDQGFCLPRAWFEAMQGFRGVPHLEDVDLVLRLRSAGRRMTMVGPPVWTSARQYEHQGIVPGIVFNLGRLSAALCLYVLSGDHFQWRRFSNLQSSPEKAGYPS